MKKENRELAKQRKAEERRKAEQKRKLKKALAIGLPAVLVVILIIAIIVSSVNANKSEPESETETQAVTDTSSDGSTEAESAAAGLRTDTSLVVADGDTVNIDYVGTVDGVEFDGGSTGGAGTDLVIGSGSYIDDFEEQLVGHNVGETVEVTVTFPENYGVEELNGKEAVFTTTINGIY